VKEFIQTNYQFLLLCFLWIGIGFIAGSIPAVVFVVTSVLLLKRKNLYQEIFLGFMLILILSDSRERGFNFAIDVKPVYIVLLSAFLFFDTQKFSSFSRLIYLFLPFLLVAIFLNVNSEDWIASTQKSLSYALILFIIPNYLIKTYKERGEIIFKNIVYLFSVVLIAGIVLKLSGSSLPYLGDRYRGVFGNPNGIGVFCSIFFLLLRTIEHYFPSLFSRQERVSIYGLIFFSIFLASSRNSIMCVLIYLLFLRLSKISPFISVLIFIVIVSSYQFLFTYFELFIQRLGLGEYFRISTLSTGSGRDIAWTFAWDNIQKNFFFGRGFGYDELLYRANYQELSIRGHQGNAHNSYLTIWLNTGIIGLFLFMTGFLLAFFKGTKNTVIALPIMFAVLFSANFESWAAGSLNPITFQLWLILTIITSDHFSKEKNSAAVSELGERPK